MSYLLLLGIFCVLLVCNGLESGVSLDGDSDFVNYDTVEVEIKNNFVDQHLDIYWVSNTGDEDVLLLSLEPLEAKFMNTFIGHKFYAYADAGVVVKPDEIIIKNGINLYNFGEEVQETRSSAASKVKKHDNSNSNNNNVKKYVVNNNRHVHENIEGVVEYNVRNETRRHPKIKLLKHKTTAMSAKFRCLVPNGVDYYYDDGKDGTFQGVLTLGRETTTNTYEGHVFYFTQKGNKNKVIARFKMVKDQYFYVITDKSNPPPSEHQELVNKELKFMEEYYDRTGLLWRHYYGPNGPRSPPTLYQWPANNIGQVHQIYSNNGYWTSTKHQEPDPILFDLEVVSLQPRVFIIENFLSDFEANEIIKHAKSKLQESTVGNNDGGGTRASDTRTSKNAWIPRNSSPVLDTLYLRAADVLRIDEKMLFTSTNAEDMQVVNYVNGQKYDSHHDWGVSGYAESRFITLLLYLTDMVDIDAGGETAFPKGADGYGFKVHPGKCSAVLFYNLLEDGNGDDLALHAALPIHNGEKWLANFWVIFLYIYLFLALNHLPCF